MFFYIFGFNFGTLLKISTLSYPYCISYLFLHASAIYIHKYINRILVLMQIFFILKFATSLAICYCNVDGMVSTYKREQEGYFTIHLIQSLLLVALSSDCKDGARECRFFCFTSWRAILSSSFCLSFCLAMSLYCGGIS